jgi:hypothetical protein
LYQSTPGCGKLYLVISNRIGAPLGGKRTRNRVFALAMGGIITGSGSGKLALMPTDKLNNFVQAFAAARLLLERANREKFLIESLALYASSIDAFLRIALVLKRQLVKQDGEVDDLLISQQLNGRFYTEREIHKFAQSEHVIEDELFKEIGELYDQRNNIIHKFFLTDIVYAHLRLTLDRYERVYGSLFKIVYQLENEQIEQGVGMTGLGKCVGQETVDDVLKKINPTFRRE